MSENSNYPKMTPFGAKYVEPESTSKRVRSLGLSGIRNYGKLTSSFRLLPDYLIIGTKRGGTTSLARWLTQHPEISSLFPKRETRKGTYYFDVNYSKGMNWYKSFFPTKVSHELKEKRSGHKLLLGDATPYYLYHPHAPKRASRVIPNAKVIALLRNPIERAFSHWVERSRQGVETLPFDEAIDLEKTRLEGETQKMLEDPGYTSFPHQHYSYIDQGKYSQCLQRWMDVYPQHQILFLKSEDLYSEPKETYQQVLDFLEISEHEPKEFSAWNMKKKPELDPKVRKKLSTEFEEDIEKVESILQRKMNWL